MIPYADSIDRHDIVNYWGQGYVLLYGKGEWSAYKLHNVEPNGCCTLRKQMGLSAKAAPLVVEFTRDEFFEHVMLHRPGLGTVITSTGEIVHLSWIAARGDKVKSIVPGDIYVQTLGQIVAPQEDAPKIKATTINDLAKIWSRTLHEYRDNGARPRIETIYPEPDRINRKTMRGIQRVRKKARADVMTLVLAYLNRPPTSFHSAATKALEEGGAVTDNGVWFLRGKGRAVQANTGTTRLGTVLIPEDGSSPQFIPLKHKIPARQRVIRALASKLIPIYGGTS